MNPVKNRFRWSWYDLLALILLIIAASIAWSKRIGGGDTFVSLAAGRDTLAGKMGLPDEWSFTTENRVWLDQNWGSHTTYYVSYRLLGDAGPVIVKWLVIFGTMLLMVRAATARGANRVLAAAVVAVTILVARSYLDVRPHIFTLLFEAALIVVLFKWYDGSALWALVAAAIIGLWTNMHGGFIFGIGVLGLWFGVQGLMKLAWGRSRPWGWSHLLVLAIALCIGILLAAFVNPFGPVNLTHPLVVEKSPIWLSVQEWHPILDLKALAENMEFKQKHGFGSVTEFLVLMGVFAGVLLAWGLMRLVGMRPDASAQSKSTDQRRRRDPRHRRRPSKQRNQTYTVPRDWIARAGLFDLALAAVVIAMAFKARRFIPLATVAVVPMLVAMLEDMMGRIKRLAVGRRCVVWTPLWRNVLAGVNVVLLITGLVMVRMCIALPYHDPNPCYPKQSVLMRMVGSQTFPKGAMDFLTAQEDLPPETFVDWRWEGYTRWRTDQLKTFCGGRAQQVHSERIAKWQINTPGEGVRPLHVRRIRNGVGINNGKLVVAVNPQVPMVAEIAGNRMPPLARLRAAIYVQDGNELKRYDADKTVGWKFAERTECWADIDVAVERTTAPRFRAEYQLKIQGDPRVKGTGPVPCAYCQVRLKRLVNTGPQAYRVEAHTLLMDSILQGKVRPVGNRPIAYWQSSEVRFGLVDIPNEGEMHCRVDTPKKPRRIESVGQIGKTLEPNEAYQPERAACVVFIHRAQPAVGPNRTLNFLRYLMVARDARRLVADADRHGVDLFVLPKHSTGLALLLMGSKQWACVFDDGVACVLVNRRNPRSQKLIENILAGKVTYPNEHLKALGMALTRWSVSSVESGLSQFEKDLKTALKLKPDFSTYWWLMQIRALYPQPKDPASLKRELAFWRQQWDLLSKQPVNRQHAMWTYRSQQMIAQVIGQTLAQMGKKGEAEKWRDELRKLLDMAKTLRDKYM